MKQDLFTDQQPELLNQPSGTADLLAEELSPIGPDTPVSDTSLMQARAAKGMSVGDAAYQLKVSPKVIEALEAGRWSALPGRAFTVGMLRAYGRLLAISVDGLIGQVPGEGPAAKSASQMVNSGRPARAATPRNRDAKRQEWRMFKVGGVMVLLAGALAYAVPQSLWNEILASLPSFRSAQVAAVPVEAMPAQTPVQATAEPAPVAAIPVAVAPTSPGTLELKFAAPAWVEVRDYTGRIIYSQLNAAGSTQFITGAAPLDVLIGNAKQVQVRWRDVPVKLDKLSPDDVSRQVFE